jgi:hypothetical protein
MSDKNLHCEDISTDAERLISASLPNLKSPSANHCVLSDVAKFAANLDMYRNFFIMLVWHSHSWLCAETSGVEQQFMCSGS